MFVQFITGRVADADGLRRHHDRWHDELAPGASGWLGTTAGITPDGTGFVAARFDSADAASRNSDRPEQDAWWQEAQKCFSGDVAFEDTEDVEVIGGGGSDDAGFVQVIRGRISDVEAAKRIMAELESEGGIGRDDVIGGYVGLQPDGSYTQVVYFTSEADAREGERRDPAQRDERMQQLQALEAVAPTFLDLPDPWIDGP